MKKSSSRTEFSGGAPLTQKSSININANILSQQILKSLLENSKKVSPTTTSQLKKMPNLNINKTKSQSSKLSKL